MTFDVFTYNGEIDLLKIRLNVLDEYVDKFVVVEAKTTFSGNSKPLYFSIHERMLQKWWPKIEYFVIDEDYTPDEIALAESSPNTIGARHWKNEFLQKESIHKALKKYHVDDDDTVYIGDVDEIWEPVAGLRPMKLKLMVYAYYLNNRSNEEFWGTLVAPYRFIKDKCLNHLRSDKSLYSPNYMGYFGWHFTSMGGLKEVRRKLNDSYTPESYNTISVQEHLPNRLKNGIDYLGRDFQFNIDESEWPDYLKENKRLYEKLCKTPSLTSATKTNSVNTSPTPIQST